MKNARLKCWEILKKNGSITRRDAYRRCGYFNLPDLVFIWKKRGIEITDKREANDNGRGTHKRYFITQTEALRAEKEGLIPGKETP